jgi:aspartate-semialdehyde dehydrogenase
MVGQRFVSMLASHPWFEISTLAASSRSAGKTYEESVKGRWSMPTSLPDSIKDITVLDATAEIARIADSSDFVFSAVDMEKEEIRAFEEHLAKSECPVVSNNSACRDLPDVPMIIPEVNPEHMDVIPFQRKRLGTSRGFIAVKSNCSIQSYVPALHPLKDRFGLKSVLVCTYQAISGAGKTFETWPEMVDNIIPYIGGEEAKSEAEPLIVWGKLLDGKIVSDSSISITSQCVRVPVVDGHMTAIFASFANTPDIAEVMSIWKEYNGLPQELNLPSAPKQFLHYFDEENRPQTRLDRNIENGMAVSLGRLREDSLFDLKFIGLSHNTIRGAAGGAILTAELLCAKGYI